MLVSTHSTEIIGVPDQYLRAVSAKCSVDSSDDVQIDTIKYFSVDSRTGDGIELLRTSLIRFVTQDYLDHSRVLVPGWFDPLESNLRKLSSSCRFSIGREEFLSICSECWIANSVSIDEGDSSVQVKNALLLFHHWGLIFLLPDSSTPEGRGDIVLNPQDLVDVLKAVITVKSVPVCRDDVFNHQHAGYIWPDYDTRLHPQFITLLHNYELAYEILDQKGDPSGRSLVPVHLPEPSLPLVDMTEQDLRRQIMSVWDGKSNPALMIKNCMISQGYIRITFDCLLPNLFPKLLVRLRHMSCSFDCSRHHCLIHIPERVPGSGLVVGWSLCCVVENRDSNSLIVYPGGCSFDATSITHEAIRCLLDESFSRMVLHDVSFVTANVHYTQEMITNILSTATPDSSKSFGFLLPLLPHMNRQQANVMSLMSLSLPADAITSFGRLHEACRVYIETNQTEYWRHISRSLLDCIPLFRQYGLMVRPDPYILWLAGISSSSLHLVGVSPRVNPLDPWEVEWESEIIVRHHDIRSSPPQRSAAPLLCGLLLESLRLVVADPNVLTEWYYGRDVVNVIGLVNCYGIENVERAITSHERKYFKSSRDHVGNVTYYSKSLFAQDYAVQHVHSALRDQSTTLRGQIRQEVGDERN